MKKPNKYAKINKMVTFINSNIDRNSAANIKSTHISTSLQNNYSSELKKIYDFYMSEQSVLLFTGFNGTGKKLLIEHSFGFLAPNVLTLSYDCKSATVCDDILLNFIESLQKTPDAKKIFIPKIENFNKTFNRYLTICNFPILIFINSFDNVQEKNTKLILDFLASALSSRKVKLIITSKTFNSAAFPETISYSKIISKPLSKTTFSEYIASKNIEANDSDLEALYKLTRGYYYYTMLSCNVIESSKNNLKEFLSKANNAGKIFDKFLCEMSISILPIPIRNFFWFLLLIRHGISYDALSVLDLYDEISVKHLLKNGYIYETSGKIFVSNYFHSDVEIQIPIKVKQKLHKYLVEIYKNQLYEKPENRVLKLSRQSLNAEIEYHTLKSNSTDEQVNEIKQQEAETKKTTVKAIASTPVQQILRKEDGDLLSQAEKYVSNFKFTEAIETYQELLQQLTDERKKIDIYTRLGRIYTKISDWSKAIHYYTLTQEFFTKNNEPININYVKYELADVYFNTYNREEARKTLKDVIFSQDSPRGLMIDACLRLGNYEDILGNYKSAFEFFKQGLDSIDETTPKETVNELYFRYAVALDEQGKEDSAIIYYEKYLKSNDFEFKSATLCNLGNIFKEKGQPKDAEKFFAEAYNYDTSNNNYDGIYYSSMNLAKLLFDSAIKRAYKFIQTAINSAETLNDSFYIAEAHLLAGDYYYRINNNEKALQEYITVYMNVKDEFSKDNLKKITDRIRDMELRLGSEKYAEIMKRHG